ncbi:MAG: ABC transporter permease [Acidimicrobiia bacterium]
MSLAARRALAIAGVSLRRLARDRVALFFAFALPVFIIVVLGFVVTGNTLPVGVVQLDDQPLAGALRRDLDQAHRLTVHTYASESSLRRAVRRGNVAGGVVVPRGYDAALRAGRSATVLLVLDRGQPDSEAVRSRLSSVVAHQRAVVQAARFAVREAGGRFDARLRQARALAARSTELRVVTTTAGHSALSNVNVAGYETAGELVLFLFLVSLTGAGDIVESRRLGVSRRVLASPTTPGTLILGEGLGRLLIAALQGAFTIVMGSLFFSFRWGDPVAVLAVVTTFAIVSTSVCLLVATIARTPEQATSIGPPIGIGLAMLGGCMWPLEIVGPTMRTVGHLTPHAWALDAFIELMGGDSGLVDILPQLLVLLGFAAVLLPIATWRLRRRLVG